MSYSEYGKSYDMSQTETKVRAEGGTVSEGRDEMTQKTTSAALGLVAAPLPSNCIPRESRERIVHRPR